MAFDDLAFKYSTGASTRTRKAWCGRCFSLREVEEATVRCPSCNASLRDISEAEATQARSMLASLDRMMAERMAVVESATGPFSLSPALMGLRELAALSSLGVRPVAPSEASGEGKGDDSGGGEAGEATGGGGGEASGAGAGSGSGAGAGGAGAGAGFASGDFVADADLGSLLARLMNDYGENQGAPPASKEEVGKFPTIEVDTLDKLPQEVGIRVPSIPGEIAAVPASFGPKLSKDGLTAPVVVGSPDCGEAEFTNAGAMEGAIVFLNRGKVDFATKARRAQAAGAVALVVGQTFDVWPYTMNDSKTNGEGVTIPVIMVRKEHGEKLASWALAQATADEAGAPVRLVATASNVKCVICQFEYEEGETVKQMPCQHLYHDECITHWLGQNNSCPICRFEVRTDDAEYEARRKRHRHSPDDATPYDSWFL